MRDKLQCQKSSSKSSLESEAKANGEGAMDGIHKRELAKDFGVEVTTTNFWTDSESSRKLHSDTYRNQPSELAAAVCVLQYVATVQTGSQEPANRPNDP